MRQPSARTGWPRGRAYLPAMTAISHWKDAAARDAFGRAYREAGALWPLPFVDRFVDTPAGRTYVRETAGPRGDAPPVVLLHAAGTTSLVFHRQVAALAARHRVLAADIVGDIGLSEQSAPLHTRAHTDAWIEALLDGLGIERASFVGSSFGGFLSSSFAVARPDRVRALVLLAPAATLQPFAWMANVTIWLGGHVSMPFTVRPAIRSMTGGALSDERFLEMMEAGVRGFRYDPEGIFPSELTDAELASIRAPTLALLGGDEVIYDPERAVARARRLIPRVDAAILPGLGHLLGVQRPDLVDPRIAAHLEAAERE